jgi:hypothetical protein
VPYVLALVVVAAGAALAFVLHRDRRDEVALAVRAFAEFRHALDPTAPWVRAMPAQPPQQGFRTRSGDADLDG